MNLTSKIRFLVKRTDVLSVAWLLQRAGAICLVFLIAHLVGWREYTSILNGTMGSLTLGWKLSAFLGVSYVVLYLAFVVVVPILVLAALILLVAQRCYPKTSTEPPKYESRKDSAPPD